MTKRKMNYTSTTQNYNKSKVGSYKPKTKKEDAISVNTPTKETVNITYDKVRR